MKSAASNIGREVIILQSMQTDPYLLQKDHGLGQTPAKIIHFAYFFPQEVWK